MMIMPIAKIYNTFLIMYMDISLHVGELWRSTLAIASKRPYSALSGAFKLVCMHMRKVHVQMTEL
jgi:hypothetical protein